MSEWMSEGSFEDFGKGRQNYPEVKFYVRWGDMRMGMTTPKDPAIRWIDLAYQATQQFNLGTWDEHYLIPVDKNGSEMDHYDNANETADEILDEQEFELYLDDDYNKDDLFPWEEEEDPNGL